MRQYVQEIDQVLHLMSEQELKDSIEKLCRYLLSKYREYYSVWKNWTAMLVYETEKPIQ